MNKTTNGDYNGWKNHSTWSVALWISNDESLYSAAVDFMATYKGCKPYASFIRRMGIKDDRNPDGIKWSSNRLDYSELNSRMYELGGGR